MARTSETAQVIQNAQAAAGNGTPIDVTGMQALMVEISGTYTNITANFEGSIDGGVTWNVLALLQLAATARTYVAAATAVGLYFLAECKALTHFRARTTIGAATGSMTVKATPA